MHHENRDQRTRSAVELLRKQTNITQNELNNAVMNFKKYLNDKLAEAKNNQKQISDIHKAFFALDGTTKGREAFNSRQPFPTLLKSSNLDSGEFSVIGLRMTGEEIIGRIWSYIEGLKEPDQTVAKEGMINALSQSIDERTANESVMGAKYSD